MALNSAPFSIEKKIKIKACWLCECMSVCVCVWQWEEKLSTEQCLAQHLWSASLQKKVLARILMSFFQVSSWMLPLFMSHQMQFSVLDHPHASSTRNHLALESISCMAFVSVSLTYHNDSTHFLLFNLLFPLFGGPSAENNWTATRKTLPSFVFLHNCIKKTERRSTVIIFMVIPLRAAKWNKKKWESCSMKFPLG